MDVVSGWKRAGLDWLGVSEKIIYAQLKVLRVAVACLGAALLVVAIAVCSRNTNSQLPLRARSLETAVHSSAEIDSRQYSPRSGAARPGRRLHDPHLLSRLVHFWLRGPLAALVGAIRSL